MPATLKSRMEQAAADADQSVNAWAMRCMERCAKMDEIGDCLGEIMQTAQQSMSEPDLGAFPNETRAEMLVHVCERTVNAALLLGWDGGQVAELSKAAAAKANAGSSAFHRRWKPLHRRPRRA
jgi:hypothetical protein